LDSSKVAVLNNDGKQLEQDLDNLTKSGRKDDNIERLGAWWTSARLEAAHDRQPVAQATLYGGRMALRYTAVVPALMALGFLLLIVYFRSIGGYRQIQLKAEAAQNLAYSAGVGDDP
jgi:hypothetical protein